MKNSSFQTVPLIQQLSEGSKDVEFMKELDQLKINLKLYINVKYFFSKRYC